MPLLKTYYGTGGDMNVDELHDVIPITDEAPLWSILLSALLKDQGNATLEQAVMIMYSP